VGYILVSDKLPNLDKDGIVCGDFVYTYDVTNYVNTCRDSYEELSQRKLEMAQMSHELRIPLTGLPILLNALQQVNISELSPESQDYLVFAKSNANVAYQLITEILDDMTVPDIKLEI